MGLFDGCIDKKLGKNNQLIKLALLIDWNPIRAILAKVHKRDDLVRSGGFSYDKPKFPRMWALCSLVTQGCFFAFWKLQQL